MTDVPTGLEYSCLELAGSKSIGDSQGRGIIINTVVEGDPLWSQSGKLYPSYKPWKSLWKKFSHMLPSAPLRKTCSKASEKNIHTKSTRNFQGNDKDTVHMLCKLVSLFQCQILLFFLGWNLKIFSQLTISNSQTCQ